jgi:hypothetical protein
MRTPASIIQPSSLKQQSIAGFGLRQYLNVELISFIAQPACHFIMFQTLPWTCQPIAATAYSVQHHIVFTDFGKSVEHTGA